VFDEKAKKALADDPDAAVESCVTDSQRGRELLRCQSAAGLAAFIVNFNGHLNPRLLVHPMFTAVPTPSICAVKAIKIDQIRKKKAAELNPYKNNESKDTESISNNEALPSSSDRNEGIIGRDSIDSFWSLGNVWHRKVGSKLVADCVESLIGMYFLVGGVPSALALIRSFNMPAVKGWAGEFHSMLVAPRFGISWSNVVTDVENFRREREVKKHHLIQSMAKWSSETLNYKFKNPELLLLSHTLLSGSRTRSVNVISAWSFWAMLYWISAYLVSGFTVFEMLNPLRSTISSVTSFVMICLPRSVSATNSIHICNMNLKGC